MKKIINAIAEEDVKWNLCGSLEHVRKEIDDLINRYGKDATLDIDAEYPDYGSHERYAFARVYIMREETDQEYAKRVAEEAKYREQMEARDRAEFQRLQEKFAKEAK